MDFKLSSILKFNKSYQERYEEYQSILHLDGNKELTAKERWSYFLEVSIEPQGWCAYWNILRKNCDVLGIDFPRVVLVQVLEINYEKLSAKVAISDTEEEDEYNALPRVVENAPLKDLYVTEIQESAELDVISTAECLDQLRIFYHHLWWPWDDTAYGGNFVDWISLKLEHRLKLYYDKLEGKVHYISGKTIKRMLERNQEIFDILQEINETKGDHNLSEKTLRTGDVSSFLFELYNEADILGVELRQWEIPEVRKLKDDKIKETNNVPGILLILAENDMQKAASYIQGVKEVSSSNEKIKFISHDIQECLLNYNTNDVLIVTPGNYEIKDREYFDFPVSIKGVDGLEETIISDTRSFWSIFQSMSSCVTVERLSFQLKFCPFVFIVKRGILTLDSVKFNNLFSKNSRTICIYQNATLIARQCKFSAFDTAIVCMPGSVAQLEDCVFDQNNSCIQFSEGAKISMNNCDLSTTKDIPFKYELNANDTNEVQEKPFESLEFMQRLENVNLNHIAVSDEVNTVQFI